MVLCGRVGSLDSRAYPGGGKTVTARNAAGQDLNSHRTKEKT